jgi:hypothetical protein
VIEEQARKIEIVIKALKQLSKVKTAPYAGQTDTLMIDVAKEIDEALRNAQETGTVLKEKQ